MNEKTKTKLRRLKKEFSYYAPSVLKIRTKKGQLLPFRLNAMQMKIDATIERLKAEGKPVRIIVLKYRQGGCSTYTEGRIFHSTSMTPLVHSWIVAHEEDASTNLFNMSKLYYDELPGPLKPMRKASNAKELVFENPTADPDEKKRRPGLRSKIKISTARNARAGRSDTIHNLHACLHKDSLVVLANGGSKAIKDISVGDDIITSGGCIAKVSGKFYIGKRQTYKVETWLTNEFIATTKEHKILTLKGWKPCEELNKNDWVRLPIIKLSNEISSFKYLLPNIQRKQGGGIKHTEHAEISLDFDFGYYIGYYLAEGHIKRQSTSERFCNVSFVYEKDEKFIDKACVFAKRYCTSWSNCQDDGTNRGRTTLYGTFLAHLTNEICGRTENKHIPDWFFKTNKKFIHGLLEGYFDGDGSKTKPDRLSAVSIHEKISRQIKRLILAMGYGVPSTRYSENRSRYGRKTKNVFIVDLNGDTCKNFRTNLTSKDFHKATKFKWANGAWYVKVKFAPKPHEMADVYDITVNHPDHDFETPIGVVSNSEVAFWSDAEQSMISLMQAIPNEPNTMVILESTANGIGGYFYDMWHRAKAGENEFVPLFFAWYEDPAYRMPVPMGFILTDDEKTLKQTYSLDDGQLVWRRWCVANNCGGNLDMFKQEYPSNDFEAFLASGRPVFDVEAVVRRKMALERQYKVSPPKRGHFSFEWNDPDTQDRIKDDTIKFVENPNGPITIYEDRQPGYPYVIGGDTKGEGKDFYAGTVINNATGKRCATIRMQVTNSKPYTHQMYCIGMYYHTALIGIEMNFNTGPIEELERLQYPLQYTRQHYDSYAKKYQKKYGWKTDGNTRPLIIDKEIDLIENNIDLFTDITFLDECLTFVYDKDNRPDAESGKHDDVLFADMIANEIRTQQSMSLTGTKPFLPGDAVPQKRRSFDEDEPDPWDKVPSVSFYDV